MQVVTIVANQRGTDEWGVMNGMTYRQIEHVAGALVADKMFVARVLLQGLGKATKPKDRQGEDRADGRGSQGFTFDGSKLPDWYKPMKSRPGIPKISAGVVDLRDGGEVGDIFAMQARAAKGTVSEDRHSPKMREPRSRQRVTRRDDEDR
jgi:hypothetical protein